MPALTRTKKKIVAVLAGVAVAAAVGASASTLGGTSAEALGADAGTVASAVSQGVVVSWDTEYSAQAGEYVVTGVTLKTKGAGEAFPAGADVKLAVTGSASGSASDPQTKLAEFGKILTTAQASLTWPASIPAQDVLGVAVVVDGNAVPATVAR